MHAFDSKLEGTVKLRHRRGPAVLGGGDSRPLYGYKRPPGAELEAKIRPTFPLNAADFLNLTVPSKSIVTIYPARVWHMIQFLRSCHYSSHVWFLHRPRGPMQLVYT